MNRLMKPYRLPTCVLVLWLLAGAGLIFPENGMSQPAWVPTRPANDANTRKGYDYFYSLEYDKAIREFEAAQQAHPEDPFATNHLLSAVIFKELFRIGALDTESFAGDAFLKRQSIPLDPKVRDQVHQLTDKAFQQSHQYLAKNPDDVDAMYSRAVTRGLRATYMGIAEKAWFPALRSAVGARRDDERVLELDPHYVDAKTAIGIHLYVVGSLSLPVKVAASIVGISGSKSRGLQYLREAAAGNGESASDAKIALALFLRREQQYKEAIKVVGELSAAYPRNFLMATEYANLLNAAGQGPEAIAAFRKIIAGCHSNAYTICRLEVPAYGLGEALKGQHDYHGAVQAYELTAASAPDPELRQRATLTAGEMYDLLQKRDAALEKYKAVIAENSSSISADLARHYMKEAYKTP
jgi:tetratricopeptide (TPR) repeat protein